MATVHKIGISPNQEWKLNDNLGLKFEDLIFQVISKELVPYYSFGTLIKQTPSSGDGGKDIVITSPINISSLGQSFKSKDNSLLKIYIECKSTNLDCLRFEKIICNVSKMKKEKVDYFVLVTNSYILPNTYYQVYEDLKINNIEFILIDQYILAKYLIGMGVSQPQQIPLCKDDISFYGEYQVLAEKENGKNIFDIYLVCRNYTSKNHKTTISLLTDVNWDIESSAFAFVISPNGGFTRKISITRLYSDGIDDLMIKFKTEQNESIVHIRGTDLKEVFEPPFTGEANKRIKSKLRDNIKTAKGLQLLYLWGDAGIGKSRIKQELFKDLDGKIYDFHFFTFNNNHKNPTKSIFDFLSKKDRFLKNANPSSNLSHIINISSNEFNRRAIILLDDCHYAESDFFEQIKLLKESSAPVTILLCGRTDYSEGELSYFSFVQWITDLYPDNGYTVAPLEYGETENLIRAMINEVPDEVLKKLCDMSMNNPLYIVQFIEYLLETELVKLINRNTVGISNPATFINHISIPDKINEIYKKRIAHLLKFDKGNNCFEFLLLLTVFNGDVRSNFFDEDLSIIQELLNKRFIKKGEDRNIVFVHESMYIYIKNLLFDEKNDKYRKHIANYIISNSNSLLSQLSDYDIGRLYLWIKNKEKSKKYFTSIINILHKIDNYSNYNISIDVYNYLYDIYKLYKEDENNNLNLLIKIINARVYITLHYLAPINAISECEKGLNLISSSIFKDEEKSKYALLSLKAQKAHALLNAGRLSDGELVLKELQSQWLISKESFDKETLFDMIDRLCSVYIKYNCYEIALNYCDLMLTIAEDSKNNSLIALAHRTRSKLFFYTNKNECKKSLEIANKLSQNGSSVRIDDDNLLSELLFEMQYDVNCDWEKIYNDADKIRKTSFNNSFYKSYIRSYMVCSVSKLKLSINKKDLLAVRKLIQQGIDVSIRFGIPAHIWQFYNLIAIVDTRIGHETQHIHQLFNTVFTMLAEQNLLYIGNKDFCFSNLMAISNVGFFLQSEISENSFNSNISKVTYAGYLQFCNYNYTNPNRSSVDDAYLKKQYNKARNKQLLFIEQAPSYILRDEETKYFIALS